MDIAPTGLQSDPPTSGASHAPTSSPSKTLGANAPRGREEASTQNGELADAKVLIVDDETGVRRMLRRALESENVRCFETDSGEASLGIARRVRPDAIVLDVNLPNSRNGFDLCRCLKRGLLTQDIPILLVSGLYTSSADREKAMEAGAADFLSKPFPNTQLKRVLAGMLRPRARTEQAPIKGTVVILDDEPDWLAVMEIWFKDAGHRVIIARDESDLIEKSLASNTDCVILDFDLRRSTAHEVCARLRGHPALRTVPIVIHTGHDGERLRSAYLGADQFVVKTGRPEELLAAVHVCLYRKQLDVGGLVSGDVKLDPTSSNVSWNDAIVATLSDMQFRLFYALVEAKGKPISRAQMAVLLFGKRAVVNSRALDRVVGRLRTALGEPLKSRVLSIRKSGWSYSAD